MNYFKFIADDVREHLSNMGISKLEDIIGQTQYLEKVKDLESQFNSIDLKDLLYKDDNLDESFFCKSRKNNPWDKGLLVRKILKKVKPAIDKNE